MQLSKILSRVAVGAAIALGASAANADTYDFVISGDYSAHFQLSSSPTPDATSDGVAFGFYDMDGTFPGASEGIADVYFGNAAVGGGMEIYDYYADVDLVFVSGDQLYTGAEDAPTFKLGAFALTDVDGPGTYTLTITNVSAVPEPESYAMLLAGIGALGFVAARRRKV